MFKREEQNFVLGNEIDNMALIMPSQSKSSSSSTANAMPPPPTDGKRAGRKREKKRLEPHNSLNVACLKRLLPIGLSFFSGREQELLQQVKQKLIEVNTRPLAIDNANFEALFLFFYLQGPQQDRNEKSFNLHIHFLIIKRAALVEKYGFGGWSVSQF